MIDIHSRAINMMMKPRECWFGLRGQKWEVRSEEWKRKWKWWILSGVHYEVTTRGDDDDNDNDYDDDDDDDDDDKDQGEK